MENIVTRLIDINPQLAIELLQRNKHNRPMSQKTIDFYANEMKLGKWKVNGESVIIANDGTLIDGQHRLMAVIKSNTVQQFIVIYGVNPDVFSTVDVGKTRTASDVFAIAGVKNSARTAASIVIYKRMKNNSFAQNSNIKELKISKQDILFEYRLNENLWDEVVNSAFKFLSKLNIIEGTKIAAYMFFLIKDKGYEISVVENFFNILTDINNNSNISIMLLREKLIKSKLGNSRIKGIYQHAFIVKTWNKYIRNDKSSKLLRINFDVEDMPLFI